MQINLPDNPRIVKKAAESGYKTVEDYVRHLVEEDAGVHEPDDEGASSLSDAEWQRRFDELVALAEPGNPNVDDSRESIYQVR